jgi:polar amino acid transport system substrate-binding protein
MKYGRCVALFVALSSALTGAPAGAEKIIVVTEEWPPFRIQDPRSRYGFVGIDIDILELLAAELGVELDVQRHPFARILEMIKKDQADLVTGIARTPERAEYIHYIPTPYYAVGPVFYTQAGKGNSIREYDDLYKITVGYSLNSAYFEPFNSDPRLKKNGLSTEAQLLQMLALGRLEAIIGTNPNLAYDVKRLGLRDKVQQAAYVPSQQTPIYFGLSRGSRLLSQADRIDRFIRRLSQGQELQRITEKYR